MSAPAFGVKVTDMLGILRIEHRTWDRGDAERYARDAIADGCREAIVINAYSGLQLSRWSPEDLRL